MPVQQRAYAPISAAPARRDGAPILSRRLLEGAPLPLLLRLAAPNAVAFLVQAGVSMTEIAIVARLGTVPLAALALMFPALMLMQLLANGAIGGAVSSAVARALGAEDRERVQALVWHALFIAVAAGLGFLVLFGLLGRALLDISGAPAPVTAAAAQYALILFGGAPLVWIAALASAVFRGMGNMRLPAALMVAGAAVQVLMAVGLVLGLFGLPRLGLAGAAVAVIVVATANGAILLWRLARGIGLTARSARPSRRILADVFRVGAPAALSPLFTVLTVVLVNALVGGFGESALAGYGIVARLEFLLIPMVFGLGAAMTAVVGASVGAGDVARAERVGWVGGLTASLLTGSVGLLLAIWPGAWIGLFTADPAIRLAGAAYLHLVGPVFAFQGLGLSLYFASQGAGTVGWPVFATLLRFVIGVGGGAVCVHQFGLGLSAVFTCLAAGMLVYGVVTAGSVVFGAWRRTAVRS